MKNYTDADNRQLVFVHEEISNLKKILSNQEISNSSIRSIATSLYSLLIEGKISVLKRFIGKDIFIEAPNFKANIELCKKKKVGMYVVPSEPLRYLRALTRPSGILASMHLISNEDRQFLLTRTKPIPWKYTIFLKQEVVYYKGGCATRHDIIKYVRNKLGGAHFDVSLKKPFEILLNAVSNEAVRIQNPLNQSPIVNIGIQRTYEDPLQIEPILEVDVITSELLSIATLFLESSGVERFCRLIASDGYTKARGL